MNMSSLSVKGDLIVVARDSLVDLFSISLNKHNILHLPPLNAAQGLSTDRDDIVDLNISPDALFLAVMTGPSKRLIVYDIVNLKITRVFTLPRAASRARFTPDSQLLVADKTGDALLYDLKDSSNTEVKLFGHLSLLLDILMTEDSNYIISSDRDEKIRVSHYPNTYNIKSYCLGHKEFVKHIELLPNDKRYLLSASGDGSVKIWDFVDGRLCQTIDTGEYIYDKQSLNSFIETMDKDGVEVTTLPIVNISTLKCNAQSSLLAVSVFSLKMILIFKINQQEKQFEHKLLHNLPMEHFPSIFKFDERKLYVCFDLEETIVQVYRMPEDENESFNLFSTYTMFMGENSMSKKEVDINLLYKRKFDNVQEYQERKRQRLEKNGET